MSSRRATWCDPEAQKDYCRRVTRLVRKLSDENDASAFNHAYLLFPESISGNLSRIERAADANRWEDVREYIGWLQDQRIHRGLTPGYGLLRESDLALCRPEKNPELF